MTKVWQQLVRGGQYRNYRLQMSDLGFSLEIILTATMPVAEIKYALLLRAKMLDLLTSPIAVSRLGGYFRAAELGQKFYYHSIPTGQRLDRDKAALQQMLDRLCILADVYRQMIALGGEALPILRRNVVKQGRISKLTHQLVQDIERETTDRLFPQHRRLFCLRCLARCQPISVELNATVLHKVNLTYYGCRVCGQSRDFFEGQVVLVLDEAMIKGQEIVGDTLRINWLAWRILVDFDEVQIVRTDDEAIERLAVQIGNDTDLVRQAAYATMRCWVSASCDLAPSSMRLLGMVFGVVESVSDT